METQGRPAVGPGRRPRRHAFYRQGQIDCSREPRQPLSSGATAQRWAQGVLRERAEAWLRAARRGHRSGPAASTAGRSEAGVARFPPVLFLQSHLAPGRVLRCTLYPHSVFIIYLQVFFKSGLLRCTLHSGSSVPLSVRCVRVTQADSR